MCKIIAELNVKNRLVRVKINSFITEYCSEPRIYRTTYELIKI